MIGQAVVSGKSEDEILNAALQQFQSQYESEQEEYNNIFNDSDFWET